MSSDPVITRDEVNAASPEIPARLTCYPRTSVLDMIQMRRTARVLVVEDSFTQALKLQRTLQSAGFEVEVARDGQKGLEVFAASYFDLVLTDVVMPGLSGYELCRRIKADAKGQDPPIILLTSLKEPRDIIQGLECGADNFISKPYEATHLIARIDALLARTNRRKEPGLGGGVEICFMGQRFTIIPGKGQVLTFLASTFEDYVLTQKREHECRLAQETQRLEAEAARNREELLRREKERLDRTLQDLVAMQRELCEINTELDNKVEELTKANMSLLEMNRVKSDFLATTSHELRTPLNSILGFSEILASSGQLSERHRRYVANIQISGKMLLVLINDILDSAKLESGKMEVRGEDFSIREECQALANVVGPLAERKNIGLECDLDGRNLPVHQDPGKVRQIIYNLLSNAIKFTPSGGRVTLRCHAEGRHVILSVADTGIGIAEEDHEKIFEKFRQVRQPKQRDDVLIREHQGTGLGLSIVRELTRLLGGDISLESRLGQGSTFTVRIPQQLSCRRNYEVNLADAESDLSEARWIETRTSLLPLAELASVDSQSPVQAPPSAETSIRCRGR